ncbi:hypothetical protein MLD38_033185 [Melastoma candidum]|uniref:Uncharacterized protein n=1 Tax=Melastoma candidum TaxID=119954 RepID=A0ACB9M784_9MYRT|nr:hypothetical protein MLD38_033185 [Melastoma candidum]
MIITGNLPPPKSPITGNVFFVFQMNVSECLSEHRNEQFFLLGDNTAKGPRPKLPFCRFGEIIEEEEGEREYVIPFSSIKTGDEEWRPKHVTSVVRIRFDHSPLK